MGFRDELYGQYVSTFKGAAHAADDWWSYKYLPLLADLPRDAAILEIGCGGGELLAFLGRHGFDRARGVDISAEQVASIGLHERFGFVKVGHFREVGKKFGGWLDAVTYQLML